jgi:hypothetical protein
MRVRGAGEWDGSDKGWKALINNVNSCVMVVGEGSGSRKMIINNIKSEIVR